jgi:ectoine hydroxylase-related dioxygenase (phytanoyl-CoA dioxygenase family)
MSLFDQIEDALGPFDVADIEGLGYPEIYWRLVRPDAAGDVAGAHTDEWFYTYTNRLTPQQQAGLVKVWVGVHVDPGRSGLAVVPDSHQKDWPNHAEMRHGRPKPVLDVDQRTLNLVNLDVKPGEAVVFHIRLLHAGIAHTGTRCRISMEFAIRLRK